MALNSLAERLQFFLYGFLCVFPYPGTAKPMFGTWICTANAICQLTEIHEFLLVIVAESQVVIQSTGKRIALTAWQLNWIGSPKRREHSFSLIRSGHVTTNVEFVGQKMIVFKHKLLFDPDRPADAPALNVCVFFSRQFFLSSAISLHRNFKGKTKTGFQFNWVEHWAGLRWHKANYIFRLVSYVWRSPLVRCRAMIIIQSVSWISTLQEVDTQQ